MATEQSFTAIDTFDASFGKTAFPFFGGGVQVSDAEKATLSEISNALGV